MIRHWTIEVDGAKYRTIYGQEGGKTTTTEWYPSLATNVGRANERSAEDQALFEAEAQWKKNQEIGYWQNVKDIDKSLRHIEVMLAKKYRDRKKSIDFTQGSWGVQIKFNGNRCAATNRGFWTRGGKLYASIPHIVQALEGFFEAWPGAVLDGELFNYELRQRLNDLTSIIRKSKPSTSDLNESKSLVRFYIYDGYGFAGMTEDTPYATRKAWIDKNIIAKFDFCEKVHTMLVDSEKKMLAIYEEALNDNQEGVILRDMNSAYEHKRSNSLLKVKPEDDDECVIQAIVEGKGERHGTAQNAVVRWKGKEFEAVFMGSHEDRARVLAQQQKMIGRKVTFLFMGLTGLGVPNYARIDPNNCLKGDR
jgi:DNA ligase-1